MILSNIFKKHQETRLSYNIYIIMSIVTFLIQTLPFAYQNLTINYNVVLLIIYSIITVIIPLLTGLYFERNNQSFVSHLILFALSINGYIKGFFYFDTIVPNGILNFFILLIGFLMAIYTLIKIYGHKYELRSFLQKPSYSIMIVIVISLVKVFLDYGFSLMSIYLLIFLAILFSQKQVTTLILSLSIYFNSLVSNLYILFNQISYPASDYVMTIISIIINLFMIIYIRRVFYMAEENSENIIYYN